MKPLVVLAALLALALPASAQDGPAGLYGGGFVGLSTDPYVGESTSATGIPIIGYRGDTFSIGTDGAFATVMEGERAEVEVFLRPRFFALIDPDAPELAGIDRDITLDAGIGYSLDLSDRTSFDVSVAQEITGEHDGQEVDLRLTRGLAMGGLPIGVYAGATWRSSELSSFLFGVRPGEAIAGRPAYALGATTTPYVGINTSIPLSQSTRLFGGVQADFLSREVEDSPIVDDGTTFSLGLGIQFSF